MNKDKENKTDSFKYFIFAMVILCFVGFPACISSYAVYRYFKIDEDQLVFKLKSEMQKMSNELRRNLLAENYFCRSFFDFYISEHSSGESNPRNIIDYYLNLQKKYGNDIDCVVLNNDGDVLYNSNPNTYNYTKKEWSNAYHYIRSNHGYYYNLARENGKPYGKGDIRDARKILGPQLVEQMLEAFLDSERLSFYWADYTDKIPPSGVYSLKWGGYFIFIKKELLASTKHFNHLAFEFANGKDITVGTFENNNIIKSFTSNKEILFEEEVKNALNDNKYLGKDYIETDNYYICNQFIKNNTYAFTLVNRKNTNFELWSKSLLVFLLYILFSYSLIRYCWNTIVLKEPGTASIRLKLAFLFLFASGIPLLTLAVIAREYELYKRLALMEEAKIWSVEKLIGIEQRYLSFLKNICNDFDDYMYKWSKNIKNREINFKDVRNFRNFIKKYNGYDFYCIGSDSQYIATTEGLFYYTGSLENITFDDKKSKKLERIKDYRINEIKTINIIVKKLCSDLNGSEMPGLILSKIELIAENIIQKPFTEIIYSIVDTLGHIKEWGFSSKSNLTYFKFISVYNKVITDYVFFASWGLVPLQQRFFDEKLDEANRNPMNFKFIAYERLDKVIFPNIYSKSKEIERFASRATDKPTEEIETLTYNGEEYIAVSFKGRNLNRYNIVGLYPMRNIDNQIKQQRFIFGFLGFICFILSIGLSHLLTKSFVTPLLSLQEGALAIENRNFEHRLQNLNVDEFGEVGGIFNHVMVGLEELEVAKIVQESMFPKPEFEQGKFSIYGKSVTMIDVGGDYLDFFKIDDNSFGTLVGDVAGHGVGAAVIMAMAKAAILGGSDYLKSPAAVLNALHKMILATKNAKQKKIMTFQYLYVNSETGENLYGNAGACSPWLVRHSTNSVEEVKMAGAALGAFKRAVYREMPLDLKPGDALVFYTDGIVECKDKNGEMLGYERLKKLLLRTWDSNPKTYYNNIYKAYIDYVGEDAEAGDDLTFVILVYNE